MAKVIALCGKISCGKSYYARTLRRERRAAVLSMDEVMLALFPLYLGDQHEEIAARVRALLLSKAAELLESDVDVILDDGFWTRAGRDRLRAFCAEHGAACEFHYIDTDEATRRERVARRNRAVEAGEERAYPVDDNLWEKCEDIFEPPAPDEADVRTVRESGPGRG